MDFLTPYSSEFDTFLARTAFTKQPERLYAPIKYILDLGGKRIRPLLLLMASEAVGGDLQVALDGAMAVELFHNFTLLHDDIMDDAPLRRGESTVHEKYDVNTAILSGDAMMILAYQFLGKYERADIINVFSQMAIEVCEGQQMDMDFETRDDVQIAEYIEMIKLKTSVLIGAALEIGALIGGAQSADAHHLYQYGVNIGIAFQIQDDLLDTYGTPAVGKQKCGDIIQNKKTYLYLKARETASIAEKTQLDELYASSPPDPTDKIQKVLAIYKNANVQGYSEELKLVYQNLAISHLHAARLSDSATEMFTQFGDYLLSRAT